METIKDVREFNRDEILGQKFFRITITDFERQQKQSRITGEFYQRTMAVCRCDCGTSFMSELSNILAGGCCSCGCLNRTQNGLTASPIYRDWMAKKRIPSLVFCEEWHDFQSYYEWAIENGFDDNDSQVYCINPDKFFSPENAYVGKRNRKKKKAKHYFHLVSPEGEEFIASSLNDFCLEHGLNPYMMHRVAGAREYYNEHAKKKKESHLTHAGWIVTRHLRKTPKPPSYEDRFYYPYTDLI